MAECECSLRQRESRLCTYAITGLPDLPEARLPMKPMTLDERIARTLALIFFGIILGLILCDSAHSQPICKMLSPMQFTAVWQIANHKTDCDPFPLVPGGL